MNWLKLTSYGNQVLVRHEDISAIGATGGGDSFAQTSLHLAGGGTLYVDQTLEQIARQQPIENPAIAMETGTAKTAGPGPKDDSAARRDRPTPASEKQSND